MGRPCEAFDVGLEDFDRRPLKLWQNQSASLATGRFCLYMYLCVRSLGKTAGGRGGSESLAGKMKISPPPSRVLFVFVFLVYFFYSPIA